MQQEEKPEPALPDEKVEEHEEHSEAPASAYTATSLQATGKPRKSRQLHRASRRQYASLRAGLAVVAGRTVGAISRRLHMGGGTSIAGVVAQRLYPEIVAHLATQLQHGSVMITGTNGKTTTSGFIASIFRKAGLRVWQNREGSNLMRGVASSLVIRAQANGNLRRSGRAISILEVDEAALPQAVQAVCPRVLVFTNLFRDQLDRYGEVHSVLAYWQRAISKLPESSTLVLNADDPAIAQLGRNFAGNVLYYGIDDLSLASGHSKEETSGHQVLDSTTCPLCGGEYLYDVRFYSHMGHYHCVNGDTARPQPDVRATSVQLDTFDRYRLTLEQNRQRQELIVPLAGTYNIYNALAAATTAVALSIDWEAVTQGIGQFKAVFGRGESVQAEGRTLRLFLAKNPTGFNEVLRTLFSEQTAQHALFLLNDNTADGRDISWIWDVDFERVVGQTQSLVVAGTRALDLALRLKYAGVAESSMQIVPSVPSGSVERKLRASGGRKQQSTAASDESSGHALPAAEVRRYGVKNALDLALQQTPIGETLFIVPTYTALLEVHRELEQRGFIGRYWEG